MADGPWSHSELTAGCADAYVPDLFAAQSAWSDNQGPHYTAQADISSNVHADNSSGMGSNNANNSNVNESNDGGHVDHASMDIDLADPVDINQGGRWSKRWTQAPDGTFSYAWKFMKKAK